jgi:CheY-like chemotaxis protein
MDDVGHPSAIFGGRRMKTSLSAKPSVILVVEDELILRMMAVDLFEEAGYETVEAHNADDAIALLQRRMDIRVVFTDVQMPGSMDGIKLAALVRNKWPLIELIMTSGRYVRDIDIPERGVFLPKPYDPETLLLTTRQLSSIGVRELENI